MGSTMKVVITSSTEVQSLSPKFLSILQSNIDSDGDLERFAEQIGKLAADIQVYEKHENPSSYMFAQWYSMSPSPTVKHLYNILETLKREADMKNLVEYVRVPELTGRFQAYMNPQGTTDKTIDGIDIARSTNVRSVLPVWSCEYSYDEMKTALYDKKHPPCTLAKGKIAEVFGAYLRGIKVAIKAIQPFSEFEPTNLKVTAEVQALLRYHHPRILPLLGFCWREQDLYQHVFLVYPLMAEGSLERNLYHPIDMPFEAAQRISILVGIAQALTFLHTDVPYPAYHGNISSGNVLLDELYHPHLTGFEISGRASLDGRLVTQCNGVLHFTGTPGYMCPEQISSTASDVYSFGSLLLETWTNIRPWNEGQPPLVDQVRPVILQRTMFVPVVQYEGFRHDLNAAMLECGINCSAIDPETRPKMDQVLNQLEALLIVALQ